MYNYNLPALIGKQYISLYPLRKSHEREKGYQFSTKQPNNEQGLLFVFGDEKSRQFHMKNVPFDLDLLGFNSEGILLFVISMKSNNTTNYKTLPCKYAVEVNKNWGKDLIIGKSKLIF